jgi:hypothetical protein
MWQRFTHQHLGLAATITGPPPVQVLLSEMTPNNFFNHNKGNDGSLFNKMFVSPFLGQITCFFISQYPAMPRYPH